MCITKSLKGLPEQITPEAMGKGLPEQITPEAMGKGLPEQINLGHEIALIKNNDS